MEMTVAGTAQDSHLIPSLHEADAPRITYFEVQRYNFFCNRRRKKEKK
jgi:hypothetical protein